MSFTFSSRKVLRFSISLILLRTVAACGGQSSNPDPTATPAPSATIESSPTPEPEDESGIVRTAWTKSGDGAGWVLDTASDGAGWVWGRVSDAGGWIWGGVSGAGGWMWDRVTSLPSDVGDIFVRFWRWARATGFGEEVREIIVPTIEIAREVIDEIGGFSLTGFLWSVTKFILFALLGLIIVGLILGKLIFPFFGGLPRRIAKAIVGLFQSDQSTDTPTRRSKPVYASTVVPHPPSGTSQSTVDYKRSIPTAIDVVNRVPVQIEQFTQLSPIETVGTTAHTDHPSLAWSKSQIIELRQRVTNPTIIALFDLARVRNGDPVNYQELMDITDRTKNQVRADFAAFSRICKSVHRDEPWPIDSVPATDERSRNAYQVNEKYAEWWFGKA